MILSQGNVTAVNDAPVVAGDGTETLAATNEDTADASTANTVSALFGGQFSDAADQVSGGSSANTFAGVAVLSNGSSASTGQWQYWNGSAWVDIGASSSVLALTLTAATPLRFNPVANFNGPAPTLSVALVDSSGGALTTGAHVNVTSRGGTTPYSSGSVVLDHTVIANPDIPTVGGDGTESLAAINEDSPSASLTNTVGSIFGAQFSDAADQVSGGSSANSMIGVIVTGNGSSGGTGQWQYYNGSSWVDIGAVANNHGLYLLTSTPLQFNPASNFNGTAPSLTVHFIKAAPPPSSPTPSTSTPPPALTRSAPRR